MAIVSSQEKYLHSLWYTKSLLAKLKSVSFRKLSLNPKSNQSKDISNQHRFTSTRLYKIFFRRKFSKTRKTLSKSNFENGTPKTTHKSIAKLRSVKRLSPTTPRGWCLPPEFPHFCPRITVRPLTCCLENVRLSGRRQCRYQVVIFLKTLVQV